MSSSPQAATIVKPTPSNAGFTLIGARWFPLVDALDDLSGFCDTDGHLSAVVSVKPPIIAPRGAKVLGEEHGEANENQEDPNVHIEVGRVGCDGPAQ